MKAEALILWPPDVKSWLVGEGPDSGKDWRQKKKGAGGDVVVREHYRLKGLESEQALGDSEEQGILVYCSAWGHKESVST